MIVRYIPAPSLQDAGRRSIRRCEENGDTWLQAAHDKGLALSTRNNIVGALPRLFAFLREQGKMPQQPINWRRHRVLVPQPLPRALTDENLGPLFKVIDSVCDRAIVLLMLC